MYAYGSTKTEVSGEHGDPVPQDMVASPDERMFLTESGWEMLQEELRSLQARRAAILAEGQDDSDRAQPGGDRAVIDTLLLDRRIAFLRHTLSRAKPLRHADREPGVAGVGASVRVRWESGEEEDYVLVGPAEVDLSAGRISYASPVGRALLGKCRGDVVEVSTPGGTAHLRVVGVD